MAYRTNIFVQLGVFSVLADVHSTVETEPSLSSVCLGHEPPDPSGTPHPGEPVKPKQFLECPMCLAREGFVKGKAVGKSWLIPDPADLEAAAGPEPQKNVMQITGIHPRAAIDAVIPPGAVTYGLTPAKGTPPGDYALLREIVRAAPDKAIVVTWGATRKLHMWTLTMFGESLAISQVPWPATVKGIADVPGADVAVSPQDVADVSTFLARFERPFTASEYVDTVAAARAELFASADPTPGAAVAAGNSLGSLMDAIREANAAAEPKKKTVRKPRASKKVAA